MHGDTEWSLTILVFLVVFGLVAAIYAKVVVWRQVPNTSVEVERQGKSRLGGVALGVLIGALTALAFHRALFSPSPPA